jgi:hypothetical protein
VILIDELPHGMADVYLVGEDDKTLQRAIPHRLMTVMEREPGEEAVAISQQQTIDTQVATHCYQSVVLTKMRIREP